MESVGVDVYLLVDLYIHVYRQEAVARLGRGGELKGSCKINRTRLLNDVGKSWRDQVCIVVASMFSFLNGRVPMHR